LGTSIELDVREVGAREVDAAVAEELGAPTLDVDALFARRKSVIELEAAEPEPSTSAPADIAETSHTVEVARIAIVETCATATDVDVVEPPAASPKAQRNRLADGKRDSSGERTAGSRRFGLGGRVRLPPRWDGRRNVVGDDVDDAAEGVVAIKQGSRAADDLDARRGEWIDRHAVVRRGRRQIAGPNAVLQDENPFVGQAADDRGSSGGASVAHLDPRLAAQRLRDTCAEGSLEVLPTQLVRGLSDVEGVDADRRGSHLNARQAQRRRAHDDVDGDVRSGRRHVYVCVGGCVADQQDLNVVMPSPKGAKDEATGVIR
jgi:hypothetical protein